jgi:hypothetical protein
MSETNPETQRSLDELDVLVDDLKEKVSTLRDGEFDAAALEARLTELTDLATRAAKVLESFSP